jgi:YD repeat-containing protein
MVAMLDPNQSGSPSARPLTNHYDSLGRIDEQIDFMGRKLTFSYDGTYPNNITVIRDPKGHLTVESYEHGQRMAVTRGLFTPHAATWNYTYDPATLGCTSITDPNGHATTMTYDDSGNVLTRTDPLGRTTTYAYDEHNDQTLVVTPRGIPTLREFDGNGNVQRVSTLINPFQSHDTTYGYDPARAHRIRSETRRRSHTMTRAGASQW